MKTEKYFCDNCGKELINYYRPSRNIEVERLSALHQTAWMLEIDLCDECLKWGMETYYKPIEAIAIEREKWLNKLRGRTNENN